MKNKAYDLNTYSFNASEVILLDTNVWLMLYPAPSGSQSSFARKYSAGFKRILSAKTQVIMDALVLSEYINRYCRIEWDALHKGIYREFKKFRSSADFLGVGNRAAFFAREMLKLSARHDLPFSSIDIEDVLKGFESGSADLNDGLLAETCRHHGWKLVTDDGDFKNGGIEVLTTNPRLLACCL